MRDHLLGRASLLRNLKNLEMQGLEMSFVCTWALISQGGDWSVLILFLVLVALWETETDLAVWQIFLIRDIVDVNEGIMGILKESSPQRVL